MKTVRLVVWMLVGLMLSAISTSVTSAQDPLVVWHSWQENEVEALNAVLETYTVDRGTEVSLVEFANQAELIDAVTVGVASGEVPDVVLASHIWVDRLINTGAVDIYCPPGEPACSVCLQENPPEWCLYARGEFEDQIGEFLVGHLYCEPGGCPECESDFPPHWCQFVLVREELPFDILHIPFEMRCDRDWCPLGEPVWWDYAVIAGSQDWFDQEGLTLPATVSDLQTIIDSNGQVYWDPTLFPDVVAAPQDPIPSVKLPQEPVPMEEANIFITTTGEFLQLQELVGPSLTSFVLEDLQPPLFVEGAYALAQSQAPEAALDFVYYLGEEQAQATLFEMTNHFPANAEVLESVRSVSGLNEVVENGFRGRLYYPIVELAQ